MHNLECNGRIILKWVLETFLWGQNVDVTTVLLLWSMADLGAVDEEYCFCNTEDNLVQGNMNIICLPVVDWTQE